MKICKPYLELEALSREFPESAINAELTFTVAYSAGYQFFSGIESRVYTCSLFYLLQEINKDTDFIVRILISKPLEFRGPAKNYVQVDQFIAI